MIKVRLGMFKSPFATTKEFLPCFFKLMAISLRTGRHRGSRRPIETGSVAVGLPWLALL